jgi:hypothetical protein
VGNSDGQLGLENAGIRYLVISKLSVPTKQSNKFGCDPLGKKISEKNSIIKELNSSSRVSKLNSGNTL